MKRETWYDFHLIVINTAKFQTWPDFCFELFLSVCWLFPPKTRKPFEFNFKIFESQLLWLVCLSVDDIKEQPTHIANAGRPSHGRLYHLECSDIVRCRQVTMISPIDLHVVGFLNYICTKKLLALCSVWEIKAFLISCGKKVKILIFFRLLFNSSADTCCR